MIDLTMPELPVEQYKEEIINTVIDNNVTIIVADTGAGKSTQVPKYLMEAGYDVVITQKRRLAATNLAERVADELNEPLGETVGYRIGGESVGSDHTRCWFCTEELVLVRELMSRDRLSDNAVLIFDEAEAWPIDIEVLAAWAKEERLHIVIMSAHLESDALSKHFDGAPVITIPGRLFPIEQRSPSETIEQDIVNLVNEGRNVLVFESGKRSISQLCSTLEALNTGAIVLPLHGMQSKEEQDRCFQHYDSPLVIVATDVAQTSLTFTNIDAVVDSGMAKITDVVNGVQGLYLKPVSLACGKQRMGRAGRTKPGIYIDRCPVPAEDRPAFPIPEIWRVLLDQTLLRLALAGFHMESMDFFNQPPASHIRQAHQILVNLGCMENNYSVTAIGETVNRLPVSSRCARIIVEADKRGTMSQVLTIVAIMEQNGIHLPVPNRENPDRPDWRKGVPKLGSDALAQLDVFNRALHMDESRMIAAGISPEKFQRAVRTRKELSKAARRVFNLDSSGGRHAVLKSLCAGMVDQVFRRDDKLYNKKFQAYRNASEVRKISSDSLVKGPHWLIGTPFDLQVGEANKKQVSKRIQMPSKIDPRWIADIHPKWIAKVSPHMVSIRGGFFPQYDPERDTIVSKKRWYFERRVVLEEIVEDGYHPKATQLFAKWLANGFVKGTALAEVDEHNQEVLRKLDILKYQAPQMHFSVIKERGHLLSFYERMLNGARCIKEIDQLDLLKLPFDEDLEIEILKQRPNTLNILGSERALSYREGHVRVMLDDIISSGLWRQLPDSEITLPDGTPVTVVVKLSERRRFKGTNLVALKTEIQKRLSAGQSRRFRKPQKHEVQSSDEETNEKTFVRRAPRDYSRVNRRIRAEAGAGRRSLENTIWGRILNATQSVFGNRKAQ